MNDFEFDDILYTILKGIISGFLIAYLIILGLRPSAEYPDNIIEIIDRYNFYYDAFLKKFKFIYHINDIKNYYLSNLNFIFRNKKN